MLKQCKSAQLRVFHLCGTSCLFHLNKSLRQLKEVQIQILLETCVGGIYYRGLPYISSPTRCRCSSLFSFSATSICPACTCNVCVLCPSPCLPAFHSPILVQLPCKRQLLLPQWWVPWPFPSLDDTDRQSGTDRNYAGLPTNLYSACNPNAPASMCCALHPSLYLNENSGSICRSDGLCINGNGKYISRTACTDQSWRSPECIKLCVNDLAQAGNDIAITPCADGSYCCGNDGIATSCCQSGLGYFVVNGETTRVNPKTSSSIRIQSSTSSSTVCILSLQPYGSSR